VNRRYTFRMDKVGKRRVRTVLPALALIATGLVAGCSSTDAVSGSSAPSPSAAASTPAYCAAASQLQTSIKDLRSLNVITGGVSAVQAAVTKIQTNLNAFQTAAKDQFGPEITQLRTSLSTVQKAVSAAASNVNVSTLTAIATSIPAVLSSYSALQKAITSHCG
jgi:hypothetical protein